jgi:hypothetical protein
MVGWFVLVFVLGVAGGGVGGYLLGARVKAKAEQIIAVVKE